MAEICNDITEKIGRFKFDSPKFLDSQKLFREHYMLSVHSSSRIRRTWSSRIQRSRKRIAGCVDSINHS